MQQTKSNSSNYNKKDVWLIIVFAIFVGIVAKFCYPVKEFNKTNKNNVSGEIKILLDNYETEVLELSKQFDLPPSYLLALIMLESHGRKEVPARYEKSIYKKLLKVKKGKLKSFENIRQKDLKKLTKSTLKELSCSYGPFQIMGYKSFFLNIPLKTLKGKENMRYTVKWIKMTYGETLKEKNYKDAFHIHNTGKKYPENGKPKTYDPKYVQKGLKYEEIFRKILENNF